ncbi:hypothetical protein QBC43DRAFT_116938 [Cladorrhinum sp. PSN259]|nr:hypothetical protein QBC43DRAFT_116938 [Cladorrhinum sp. PSN259]
MCHHQYHTPITCNRPLPVPNLDPNNKCNAILHPEPTLIKCAFAHLMSPSSLQSQCWELDTPLEHKKNAPVTEAPEEFKERARDRCRVCAETRTSARTSSEEGSEKSRPAVGKRKDSTKLKEKMAGLLRDAEEKFKRGSLSRSGSRSGSQNGSCELDRKVQQVYGNGSGGEGGSKEEMDGDEKNEVQVQEEELLKKFMDGNVGRW